MSVAMRRLVPLLFVSAALGAVGVACEDDEAHKGTISHGPSTATQGASASAKLVRLIYAPGSPLATMRVATTLARRLEPLGMDNEDIKIGGETIHVDVAADQAPKVKKALEGGRLDLYLFDDRADPFAEKERDLPDGFRLALEATKGSERPLHFVVAPGNRRADLEKLLAENPSAGRALIGPTGEGELRSYYVQSDSSVRGEMLSAAGAEQSPEGALLLLTFEGSGKNLLRWSSKDHARFVVQIDGQVVGTTKAEETITDGVLRVPLQGSGKDALDRAKALATSLASKAGGLALSHLTVLAEERPL